MHECHNYHIFHFFKEINAFDEEYDHQDTSESKYCDGLSNLDELIL